jgi:hypothetical protein
LYARIATIDVPAAAFHVHDVVVGVYTNPVADMYWLYTWKLPSTIAGRKYTGMLKTFELSERVCVGT